LRAMAAAGTCHAVDVALERIADVSARHLAHRLAAVFDRAAA
jgi:hypothetical protein